MSSGFCDGPPVREWIVNYIEAEKAALDSIPVEQVESVILKFKEAHAEGRQIFLVGNGGSASNASHFATDLGKGSSDALGNGSRFCRSTTT